MHTARTLPLLTVIAASAGSGKTHRLTNEFLGLLLSHATANSSLRNILAITFTHNAANEMKRRVLESLKHIILADKESADLLKQLSEATGLEEHELTDSARLKIEELFDSYGDLQVQTIDSFIVEVFRTTALELGFAPGVEVKIQDATLVDRAFEELLREITPGRSRNELREAVEKLIGEQQRRSKKYLWDPYRHILRESAELRRRVQHSAKPVDAGESGTSVDSVAADLKKQSVALLAKLEQSGLSVNKNFQNDLRSLINGDLDAVVSHSVKEKFFNAPKTSAERTAFALWQPQVEQIAKELYALLSQYAFVAARSANAPFIRTLASLRDGMNAIARREGVVALDEIGRLLNAFIKQSYVPEIYFKLGDTLHHFLIDEFQDTSPLQWSIVKPLLEETLSGKGSLLVVGDTKQSIYSFRGADWRVMRRVAAGLEFSSVKPTVESLQQNFRSDGVLVDFVHELFAVRLAALAPPEIVEAASLSGLTEYEQSSKSDRAKAGAVRVEHVGLDKERTPERERLLEILSDCRARNIPLADIAVLAPRNSDVLEISGWLNEFNASQKRQEDRIPFLAQSGLDIRRRSVVRELIALLSFLDVPIDNLSFGTILSGEIFSRRIHLDGKVFPVEKFQQLLLTSRKTTRGTPALYRAFERQYPELWETCFAPLFTRVGYLPLYDLAAEALKLFRVFETFPLEQAALVRFLETVAAAESAGISVLKEFLAEAEDETAGELWRLSAPEAADAVSVMTVHKSKGLGFGTVVLMMHDNDSKTDSTVVDDENEAVRLYATNKDARGKSKELDRLYQRQLRLDQTDWLNTLYVALTRAQHELHVVIVRDAEKPLLLSSILEVSARGVLARHKGTEPRSALRVPLAISNTPRRFDVVSAKLPGLAETHRGDAMHTALSRIEFIDGEVEDTIRVAVSGMSILERGYLTEEEIVQPLAALFASPGVDELFRNKRGRRVLNEREFVNAKGQLFRCDRVVIDEDRVTVVDYKTGGDEQEEEYRTQVRNYIRLLTEIFHPKPVRGFLAYIDLRSIREVSL